MTAELIPYDTRIRSVRCKATIKRTGQRCQLQAMHGGVVCHKHGGKAPQVMRKAAARVTLQQIMRGGDRRHPWQVLLDALHSADALMRDVKVRVEESETVSPDDVQQLVDALQRASVLARMCMDTNVLQHAERQVNVEAHLVARILINTINDPELGLTELQLDVARRALRRELLALEER